MSNANEPPLSEIQWRSPQIIASMGGLHSNTILFYFAESPFFERTSNNAVIMSQAMNNMSMYHYIQTREAFEGRLKTMSGLEFIVGEEPAESGPGQGTGVWVIRKQTRRKRYQEDDEIVLHASYFVVGENIYMAPTMADVLASRILTISSAISKALPAAESARKWSPSTGHVYQLPTTPRPGTRRPRGAESKTASPLPDGPALAARKNDEWSLERATEEAFMIHMRYGGEYIDENPITGRPGDFHLSSTGRKAVPPPQATEQAGLGAMYGPGKASIKPDDRRDGKTDKSPRTVQKTRRRKSRAGTTTPVGS